MQRTIMALVAGVGLLAGGLITSFSMRAEPGLSAAEVRTVVAEMIEASQPDMTPVEETLTLSAIDPATIHPMIESYLLTNPRILERVNTALQVELRDEESQRARVALAGIRTELYDDPDHVVLGNPEGDVTLVEMFDYNCGYCRSAVPDMAALLDEDPNLRIILKEFPILSQDSVSAARIAVAASKAGVDYWAFHADLFTTRGRITAKSALDAAESQGLNRISLQLDAESQEIGDIIQRSYVIANAIGTTGTPTYIIGDEIIAGAVGLDGLRERIANMRACGETVCEG